MVRNDVDVKLIRNIMNTIEPIKAFTDNYIWCIHDKTNAVIVDPGDAEVVIRYLNSKKLNLKAILVTHKHADHIGGVSALKKQYNGVQIYSLLPEIATHLISNGDSIKIDLANCMTFKIIALPGHTLDHIAFYGNGILFCGDTLFSVGCGRVFEGTYEQMYQSLMLIRALDDDTLLYPAHEYTLKNIKFARTIEPQNNILTQYYIKCLDLVAKNIPTLPIKLGLEKLINPFLRCDVLELKSGPALIKCSPLEIFTHIRILRNGF